MKNKYKIIIFLSVVLVGCSSSSYYDRYDKTPDRKTEINDNNIRFTSESDSKEKERKTSSNKSTYSNYEEGSLPRGEVYVDTKEFIKNNKIPVELKKALTTREKILLEIIGYLETPYLYGGENKNGIDCSAFTQNVYLNSVFLNLPRTAKEQFKYGDYVGQTSLKFGDLIFFDTRTSVYPGHVGIYLGENLFAHASSSLGVTISSLKSTYYADRFISGRRINTFDK